MQHTIILCIGPSYANTSHRAYDLFPLENNDNSQGRNNSNRIKIDHSIQQTHKVGVHPVITDFIPAVQPLIKLLTDGNSIYLDIRSIGAANAGSPGSNIQFGAFTPVSGFVGKIVGLDGQDLYACTTTAHAVHNSGKVPSGSGLAQATALRYDIRHDGILLERRKLVRQAGSESNVIGTGDWHVVGGTDDKNKRVYMYTAGGDSVHVKVGYLALYLSYPKKVELFIRDHLYVN